MIDPRQVIDEQARLESDDSRFRSHWQDQANYIFPRENNITYPLNPGEPKFERLYDITSVTESERMSSGLLTNLIPAGQKFFSLGTSDNELNEVDAVKSHMATATEILHRELFTSNFLLQVGETLHSLVVFGTGLIYDEWDDGLNFKDWDISRYQVLENSKGVIDALYLKFTFTARQAFNKWGEAAGKSVVDFMKDDKKKNDKLWFIHVVRPREDKNPTLQDNTNKPWEDGYVNVKDKHLIIEAGYPEFPYQAPRWAKTSGEVHGRGIGGMILPQTKLVNAMQRDFSEKSNKGINPPSEVLSSFEGEYNTTPGAQNDVMEIPSRYIDPFYSSAYSQDKDKIESERQIIREAWFKDAFAPLSGLTGDRRNELEIRQRIQEAFRMIGTPIGRIEVELFTPLITRCYTLLVDNKVIPPPPPELQGSDFKVMYKGPLSLAQQNSEASAVLAWIEQGMAIQEGGYPVLDNVDIDKAYRRIGRVGGVNEDDITPEDERDATREQRQQDIAQQKALEAAQAAGDIYGKTTQAPEEGSAAEQMGQVGV